jgi:hypothetical protein
MIPMQLNVIIIYAMVLILFFQQELSAAWVTQRSNTFGFYQQR